MLRPIKSPIALLRLAPLLFPIVFLCAAVNGVIATLYAAVFLHLLIIAAELTVGRRFAEVPIPVFVEGSTAFEDVCLFAWAGLHVAVLGATLYFVASTELTGRQVFAVGALFGYSINTFSAAAAHELLHRDRPAQRFVAHLLYAVMLYPAIPTVQWQAITAGRGLIAIAKLQSLVSPFTPTFQAFAGGIEAVQTPQARARDGQLRFRVAVALILLAIPLCLGMPAVILLLITQGLFAFLLIETINFVQHYEHAADSGSGHANQDLNFVFRCLLFNLPLHAAHHDQPDLPYPELCPTQRPGRPGSAIGARSVAYTGYLRFGIVGTTTPVKRR